MLTVGSLCSIFTPPLMEFPVPLSFQLWQLPFFLGDPCYFVFLVYKTPRLLTSSSLEMTQQGKNTAGLLPISAVTTQKSGGSAPPAKKAPKPSAPRLKLLIRRLPPGLTQTELEDALGTQWKVGAGKVDWLQYKPGKLSKE